MAGYASRVQWIPEETLAGRTWDIVTPPVRGTPRAVAELAASRDSATMTRKICGKPICGSQ